VPRKPKLPKTLPKWIKSWCCQYPALRMGGDLRCKCCGNMLFDDYATQRLIIEGEPYDPNETVPYIPAANFT
jgi:hypothetical protein